MTTKEMIVFKRIDKENELLHEKLRRASARSNRRHRELRRLNRRMADLLTAKQLEDKFERFIHNILADYEVGDNGDDPDMTPDMIHRSGRSIVTVGWEQNKESAVSEPQPITQKHDEAEKLHNEAWGWKKRIERPDIADPETWVCPVCGFAPCRCEEAHRENV